MQKWPTLPLHNKEEEERRKMQKKTEKTREKICFFWSGL
jgi:hypothetical protein